ncbi:MAG TPA: acyl-CoA thioesterase domain-containing protein [Acidimicrobiales bacterium]|nr:acyl-CoA thioesterase domain-containing protein [Acidimicrobiales bacterium]
MSNADALAETVDFLTLAPAGDGWVGRTPAWFGNVLFGGFVLAQAIAAATRAAPEGARLHSLHAYFLRPVRGGSTVEYRNSVVRAGRTFASHELRAEQDGKPVVTMTSSFTTDTDGYDFDLGGLAPDVPPPDPSATEPGPGPWEACWVGPTEPRADGSRESTHRMWFRVPTRLPDDPHLHTALLGFATDWTGIGGRPLHLEGDTQGMVSLDHAAWFHRPARADDWLFYDVQSLVNAGGRGLLRGVMRDQAGRVVASAAQEMLLRPV